MNSTILRANALLLLVAFIWGSTFVAQRMGMDHVGPFTFNFVRFLLGALFLAPFAWKALRNPAEISEGTIKFSLMGSLLAGTMLFAGINLQQIGLVSTTAGNAGFITGLYVILVPIIGSAFGMRTRTGVWIGAPLGLAGTYLMSVSDTLSFAAGDGWVLAGAFAWAGHVLVIGWLSPRMKSYLLAFGQTAVCALLSFAAALTLETMRIDDILAAAYPLLFSGVVTTGIAFTLQVIAQKHSPPAHAALIMQLETVFAALAGWILLGEIMTSKGILGAGLILSGMLIAQFWGLAGRVPVESP
ncbi:MAG: DMT family transporter [Deltaproteobacteria bacterium]|nr:DMT family transporter [Deltaproteobacteria bacterium]